MATVLVHGTGSIGQRHLRVLGPGTLALPVRGGAVAGVETVDSYASGVARGATAAVIATATGRHLADAHDALARGCHLLIEKPIAASAAGLAGLERAAREAKRSVFVGCCLRFHAALLAFRDWLPRVGKVHHVRIECVSYLPDWRPGTDYRASYSARAGEGGVLRDVIHEIDYAGWLFGWPTEVSARIGNTGTLGIESEEWADLAWSTGDATVSLRLDYLTRPSRRVMRADGEHGTLEVDLVAQQVRLGGEVRDVPQDRDDMMRDQARAFLAAIAGGDPQQLATLDDGGRAIAICDTARSSNGAPVAVHDWRAT